jgi:hypothetical protein
MHPISGKGEPSLLGKGESSHGGKGEPSLDGRGEYSIGENGKPSRDEYSGRG